MIKNIVISAFFGLLSLIGTAQASTLHILCSLKSLCIEQPAGSCIPENDKTLDPVVHVKIDDKNIDYYKDSYSVSKKANQKLKDLASNVI